MRVSATLALGLLACGCASREVVIARWPSEPVRCVVVNDGTKPVPITDASSQPAGSELVASQGVTSPGAPKQRPPTSRSPLFSPVPPVVVRYGGAENVMGVVWCAQTSAWVVWLELSLDEEESISGWTTQEAAKAALASYAKAWAEGGRPAVIKRLNSDPDQFYVEPKSFTYEEKRRISEAVDAGFSKK